MCTYVGCDEAPQGMYVPPDGANNRFGRSPSQSPSLPPLGAPSAANPAGFAFSSPAHEELDKHSQASSSATSSTKPGKPRKRQTLQAEGLSPVELSSRAIGRGQTEPLSEKMDATLDVNGNQSRQGSKKPSFLECYQLFLGSSAVESFKEIFPQPSCA